MNLLAFVGMESTGECFIKKTLPKRQAPAANVFANN
jgi:hypothetical protein